MGYPGVKAPEKRAFESAEALLEEIVRRLSDIGEEFDCYDGRRKTGIYVSGGERDYAVYIEVEDLGDHAGEEATDLP